MTTTKGIQLNINTAAKTGTGRRNRRDTAVRKYSSIPHALPRKETPAHPTPGRITTPRNSNMHRKWQDQTINILPDGQEDTFHEPQFKKSPGGLAKVVKYMKKGVAEKEASSGKRKPLGNVSNGKRILQSKAASKKELKKIQDKLSEMC